MEGGGGGADIAAENSIMSSLHHSMMEATVNELEGMGFDVEQIGTKGDNVWFKITDGQRGLKVRFDPSGHDPHLYPTPHWNIQTTGIGDHLSCDDFLLLASSFFNL
jgi:hypothetical protein